MGKKDTKSVKSSKSSKFDIGGMINNEKSVKEQLEYYKDKVIKQDILIFEMRALLQSGKGFGDLMNLELLLQSFMSVVREKYGSVNSTVLLYDDLDPSQEYYQVKSFHNINEEYKDLEGRKETIYLFKFPKDNGLLWQIIRQGNVFSVRDLKGDSRFETAWEKWNLDILESDIWCPLIKNGEVLGVLTLGKKECGNQIAESEYPFLQELASIAITNIDSTIKYEKNQRILKNIQTLYDINQQLSNVNDFKRLCIQTLSTAVNAVKAQKGNLMLRSKGTGKLEIKVVWGNIPDHVRDSINDGVTETRAFALDEGVAGKCAMTRKPVRMNDRKQIEQFGKNQVHCICTVPLIYGGEVEGVINMTNKIVVDDEGNSTLDPIGRFTEEDESLLLGLADQAAMNLHKSKIYNESITDILTGLYNKRHFEHIYHDEYNKAIENGTTLSLAITDIDHFKKFNDNYGHKAGDEVLSKVAMVMQNCLRPGTMDMAFRYGGEEFCMLLPDTSPEKASDLMEEFRKKIEGMKVNFENQKLSVKTSVGISCFPNDTETQNGLFEKADKCLYEAKEKGRNMVITYYQGLLLKYGDTIDFEMLKKIVKNR
ncbi:MAG: diguanylate cyclase [Deltaproteobacteria bacterium]|nr:diguanylate cyclase [Deltaproteobacteria bacterium]